MANYYQNPLVDQDALSAYGNEEFLHSYLGGLGDLEAGWTITRPYASPPDTLRVTTWDVYALQKGARHSPFVRDTIKKAGFDQMLVRKRTIKDREELSPSQVNNPDLIYAAKAWAKIPKKTREYILDEYGVTSGLAKTAKDVSHAVLKAGQTFLKVSAAGAKLIPIPQAQILAKAGEAGAKVLKATDTAIQTGKPAALLKALPIDQVVKAAQSAAAPAVQEITKKAETQIQDLQRKGLPTAAAKTYYENLVKETVNKAHAAAAKAVNPQDALNKARVAVAQVRGFGPSKPNPATSAYYQKVINENVAKVRAANSAVALNKAPTKPAPAVRLPVKRAEQKVADLKKEISKLQKQAAAAQAARVKAELTIRTNDQKRQQAVMEGFSPTQAATMLRSEQARMAADVAHATAAARAAVRQGVAVQNAARVAQVPLEAVRQALRR